MFGKHKIETDDPFWLFGGGKLHSLYDLLEALERIDDSVFSYHVSPKKNDFANWIKNSIKNHAVADSLGKAKTRLEAIDFLKNFLYKYEQSQKSSDDMAFDEPVNPEKNLEKTKEEKMEKKKLFSFGKKKEELKSGSASVELPEPSKPIKTDFEKISKSKPAELEPLEPLEPLQKLEPLEPLKPLDTFESSSHLEPFKFEDNSVKQKQNEQNEKLKDSVFKTKEKKGFFGKLFSKNKKEELKPLEPLEPLKPLYPGSNSGEEFRLEEFRVGSSVLETENKLKDEGIIKSDFALKELPSGEKEEKVKLSKKEEARLKALKEKHRKKKSKKQKLNRKELSEMEDLLKKEKRLLEKEIRDKIEKKNLTSKEKIVKERENFVADKTISLEAKEARFEKLRKELEKKETIIDTREKELAEQQKRYNEMIKDIERIKKETFEDLRKRNAEIEKRYDELKNKEAYTKKKEKELEIEDRAIDYAMSEFEKEKLKLEDDEFHAYLKSKIGEMKGIPAGKTVGINDIRKAESMKVPDLSDKKMTIAESIQKCRDLLKQGKLEEAKFVYNGIRLEFFKRSYSESEKSRLYNNIRELYDDINLASLARR